jgi:hypothetical protein
MREMGINKNQEQRYRTGVFFSLYEINEIKPLVFQVQESKSSYVVDLKKRTFKFAVDV